MRKLIIGLLTGLALLVLPTTSGSAHEHESCTPSHVVVVNAHQQGWELKTELYGSGLKHFFIVYLETTQGSATDDEVEALTSQIDMIGIFQTAGAPFNILVLYKDACAINSVRLPTELVTHVLKSVEQRAKTGENT